MMKSWQRIAERQIHQGVCIAESTSQGTGGEVRVPGVLVATSKSTGNSDLGLLFLGYDGCSLARLHPLFIAESN